MTTDQHADHPMAGDPSYDGFRITSVWAWTAVDPADDQEGILPMPNGLPMIASDRVRLDDLRGLAGAMATALGMTVRLRRFVATTTEPLETIDP